MKTRSKQVRARAQAKAARERRKNLILLAAAGAAAVVIGLIALAAVLRGGETLPDRGDAHREGRVLGSEAAPVTVLVWADFQCPVCKSANQTVIKRIEDEFVAAGVVQVHFRHFAFLGQESIWAAEASECAAEQHMFWPYHDALFARQSGENRGAFTKAKLKEIAREVGLGVDRFGQCLDEGRYASVVVDERKAGQAMGVNATPTLFINGVMVADWRSYDRIRQLILRAAPGGG